MRALMQDRCTRWRRALETSSGASTVEAHYSMGHQSWMALSIGDPVTGKSREPQTTKCSRLVCPARSMDRGTRKIMASRTDALRRTSTEPVVHERDLLV